MHCFFEMRFCLVIQLDLKQLCHTPTFSCLKKRLISEGAKTRPSTNDGANELESQTGGGRELEISSSFSTKKVYLFISDNSH